MMTEARICRFYLGTHKPHWLSDQGRHGTLFHGVPLFVSRSTLSEYRTPPIAATDWALDSGGFTQLSKHGRWTIEPQRYADEACRWMERPGRLQWAAVQDWMCEPHIIAKTGLSVEEHQQRTIESYHRLRELAPGVPWVPVLQGYAHGDYFQHLRMYEADGIDLRSLPLVGLGSICRRQATSEAVAIVRDLAACGIRLHGFGLKLLGLGECAQWLVSADSMAWSYDARRSPPLAGCRHRSCANCPLWARRWYDRVRGIIAEACRRPVQRHLFDGVWMGA